MKKKLEEVIKFAIDSDYNAWFIPIKIANKLRRSQNVCCFGLGSAYWKIQEFQLLKNLIDIKWICDYEKKYRKEY